jgi:hypothetical protein
MFIYQLDIISCILLKYVLLGIFLSINFRYKCPPGEHVEYHSKISNNIIFSSVRNKS